MSSTDSILNRLVREKFIVIPVDEEHTILPVFKQIREADTMIAGPIRILTGEIGTIVIEYPDDGTNSVVLRLYTSVHQAEEFVRDRMKTYERMWDGCGCKIDYYSPPR